jgi:hypothetical protein
MITMVFALFCSDYIKSISRIIIDFDNKCTNLLQICGHRHNRRANPCRRRSDSLFKVVSPLQMVNYSGEKLVENIANAQRIYKIIAAL